MLDWLTDIHNGIEIVIAIFTLISGIVLRGYYRLTSIVKTVEKLNTVPQTVDTIKKELFANGGSSLRDAINRIEKHQCVEFAKTKLLLNDSDHMYFETDEEGMCVDANENYLKMLGIEQKDCLGNSWKQCIHPKDKEAVLAEWELCVKDKTPFDCKYRFLNKKDEAIPAHVRAMVIKSIDGKIVGWLGIVVKLKEIPKEWQDDTTYNNI